MLLGGSPQQIAAIENAKKLGFYTVLCDYLPDNPGRNFADRFYLESTTDMEKMLEIAKKEEIDGIIAYASDPAAPTAAYVSEAMGLHTNPYTSVDILCNKDKFRKFLSENGFAVPKAGGFSDKASAVDFVSDISFPIIIKPVDSSGSKGVSVLRDADTVEEKIDFAFSFSRSKRIVIEEFIEKAHTYLVGGDIFVIDGEIALWGLMNCHRDESVNKLVPVGKSYPLDLDADSERKVRETLEKLVLDLGIKNGAMNVELVVDANGKTFLIDVGPRNGGNMIPVLLGNIFGVDVVEMSVMCAMGIRPDCNIPTKPDCFMATHNLHASKNGIFDGIEYSEDVKKCIIRESLYKEKGEKVEYFDNAAKAVGIVFLKFDSKDQMKKILEGINEHIKVKVREEG